MKNNNKKKEKTEGRKLQVTGRRKKKEEEGRRRKKKEEGRRTLSMYCTPNFGNGIDMRSPLLNFVLHQSKLFWRTLITEAK